MAKKRTKTAVEIHRFPCDAGRRLNGRITHEFQIGAHYQDIILAPERGGDVSRMDKSRASEGVLRVEFSSPVTTLSAILYTLDDQG